MNTNCPPWHTPSVHACLASRPPIFMLTPMLMHSPAPQYSPTLNPPAPVPPSMHLLPPPKQDSDSLLLPPSCRLQPHTVLSHVPLHMYCHMHWEGIGHLHVCVHIWMSLHQQVISRASAGHQQGGGISRASREASGEASGGASGEASGGASGGASGEASGEASGGASRGASGGFRRGHHREASRAHQRHIKGTSRARWGHIRMWCGCRCLDDSVGGWALLLEDAIYQPDPKAHIEHITRLDLGTGRRLSGEGCRCRGPDVGWPVQCLRCVSYPQCLVPHPQCAVAPPSPCSWSPPCEPA